MGSSRDMGLPNMLFDKHGTGRSDRKPWGNERKGCDKRRETTEK